MVVGMIRPDAGEVYLGPDGGSETRITRTPMYQRARLGIGYLAQEASVFGAMSVEDNLRAVLDFQEMDREAKEARVEELIGEFGLQTVRHSKGHQLSGGERRRTEIARALATRPRFILLDEPFAGVDPIAVEDIMRIVVELRERGIGVLITDHNVHETLAITDRGVPPLRRPDLHVGHGRGAGGRRRGPAAVPRRELYAGALPGVTGAPIGNGRRSIANPPALPAMTVTIDKFGRVLIPKPVRDRLGLAPRHRARPRRPRLGRRRAVAGAPRRARRVAPRP